MDKDSRRKLSPLSGETASGSGQKQPPGRVLTEAEDGTPVWLDESQLGQNSGAGKSKEAEQLLSRLRRHFGV